MTIRRPRPLPSSVTVVVVDVRPVAEVPAAWRSCLSAGESARVERFVRAPDRVSNAAAHCLKRLCLSRATGVAPWALRLQDDAMGKPFLPDRADVGFNLSHTDGMVAVALARRLSVGVDVEATGRHGVDGDLVAAALGPAAAAGRFARLPPRRLQREFHAAWTGREAVSKADGRGLSLTPAVMRLGGRSGRVLGPGGRRWWVTRLRIGAAHALAVAAPAPLPVRLRVLEADALTRWARRAAAVAWGGGAVEARLAS